MCCETWKPVKEFEGVYEVSNLGNVRKLAYDIHFKNEKVRHVKTHNLKPLLQNSGYYRVALLPKGRKNKLFKSKLVHRLVAEAFLPNPQQLPYVNHKDENKLNNNVENLEWCTQSYNMTYNNVNKRIADKLKGRAPRNCIRVVDTASGQVWPSKEECYRSTGIPRYRITDMLNGKLDTYNGYTLRKLRY